MMFVDCPAYLDPDGTARCGLPAEVRCRYIMRSTDGRLLLRAPSRGWPCDAHACTPAAPPGEIRQLYPTELLTGTHPSSPHPPVQRAEALSERVSRMNGIVPRLTRPVVSQAGLALCPSGR